MEICKIETNKKKYLDLLLLADEQESMIDRYLERGDMFVVFNTDLEPVSSAVVTDEGDSGKLPILGCPLLDGRQQAPV